MIHKDATDRDLAAWFAHDATRRAPAELLDIVVADTQTRPQSPGWLVTLRGESMGVATRGSVRTRRATVAVVLIALVALMVAILATGRAPEHHGGLLAFVRDGDVYLANGDGSDAHAVLREDGIVFSTVAWSATGALAIDSDSGAVVMDVATGKTTFVGGHSPTWSPDGRQLAVLDQMPGTPVEGLTVGARLVDAASFSTLSFRPFPATGGLSWSPNGRWIAASGSDDVIRLDVATGYVMEIAGPSGHLDSPKEVAWSPDSTRVAFIVYRSEASRPPRPCDDNLECHIDVVVANADGTGAHAINAEPGTADQPTWSPDGRLVAYRKIVAGPQTPLGIQIAQADGTGERTLIRAEIDGYLWSPAGDRILYTLQGPSGAATVSEVSLAGDERSLGISIDNGFAPYGGTGLGFALASAENGSGVMPTFGVRGPEPTPEILLPASASPADASAAWPTIVSDIQAGCQPVAISTATGVAVPMANLCAPVADAGSTVSASAWSGGGAAYALVRAAPDGSLVLLISRRDGSVAFQRRLPGLNSGIVWSSTSTRLGFVVGDEIWIASESSSGSWSIGTVPLVGAIDLGWSPGDDRLAVERSDGSLLIGQADGGDLQSIGTLPMPASWAPDSSRFAFVRDGDVWLVNADGGGARNLSDLPLRGAVGALWSPSSEFIAIASGTGILLMSPDGAMRQWIDLGLERVGDIAWAPDATRLAVSIEDGPPHVLIVDVNGGPIVQIDASSQPSWSPDGQFLLVVESGGPGVIGGNLAVLNADGSGRHELSHTAELGLGNPVWAR